MITDIENAREHITRAVEELILPFSDSIEIKTAVDIILDFVFHDVRSPDESNRYEWFYNLTGKAITIVQGWKANTLLNIKNRSETRANLIGYIKNTYGVQYENCDIAPKK